MKQSIFLKMRILFAWVIDTCIFVGLIFLCYYLIVLLELWRSANFERFFVKSIEPNGKINMTFYDTLWKIKEFIIYYPFIFTLLSSKKRSGQWFGGASLGRKLMKLKATANKKIYMVTQFFAWVIFLLGYCVVVPVANIYSLLFFTFTYH